jgi:NADH-quinone oxidoreductase subunit C
MSKIDILATKISEHFPDFITNIVMNLGELTLEIPASYLREVCTALRDDADFRFDMLIDVCGVDYLHYGISEWETQAATAKGFERGVQVEKLKNVETTGPRFASVYHLLSLHHNHRIRLKVFLDTDQPMVGSVAHIWPAANWFEREAYDLFGIVFTGHPDLRRLLTDYGFIGHPFRKDFPVSGHVEVRYDATLQQVIYEPVSIAPRILEPKVIRRDNRYQVEE